MNALSPSQAASIARGVYFLLDQTVSEAAARADLLGCEGMFSVEDRSRFTGRSGCLSVLKRLSGFGYIAEGIGKYQGEVLVVTRGTKTAFDWLSNGNVGLALGPGGHYVHAGFHEIWKSFSTDVAAFLRGRNPSVIHCVGHSLGGALALLNADYFTSLRVAEVKLYTFGSPRVGDINFARSICQRVGEENMYRVFHCADPVPMIPMFPFFHVPLRAGGYQLGNGARGIFNKDAHGMVESYIPGVRDQSWAALRNRNLSRDGRMNVELWLEQVNAGRGMIVKGSTWCMMMITRALTWLLNKASLLIFGSISGVASAGMTALDYLAWMLGRGAALSLEISGYLTSIINAIFRFTGRTMLTGVSLTTAFIHWVLGLLYGSLSLVARQALSLLR